MSTVKSYQIKAGFKAWFEYPFQQKCGHTADVVEFSQDQALTLEPYRDNWLKVVGQVRGLPDNHPPILIHKDDVEES